jgi:general secretion pathway protein B
VSLILDALNRARQNENAVPGLATQHPVQQLTARRRQFVLWAALAVAVAIIAWLVVDRFRAPPVAADDIGAPVAELSRNIGSAVSAVTTELKARAAAAEQAQVAASTTPPPTVAAPAPASAGPVAQPAQSPEQQATDQEVTNPGMEGEGLAAQLASTPAETAAEEVAPEIPAAAIQPPPAPPTARDDAVAQLYENRDLEEEQLEREAASSTSQRRASQGDPDMQRTAEVERILREARDEMENASLDEHPAPFLADLSQLTKDSIPTLYYQRHDYSSNASDSSVTMNGNSVKTGGSILPGMKVEEILPDSVVLSFQGTQFRLRALNSWVNL